MKDIESKRQFNQPFSNEENEKLFKEFKENGSKQAREKLINGNMRLITFVISKYFMNLQYDKSDLISVGTVGLIKAVDAFNLNKNIKFGTFATRCIYNEILQYHRKFKRTLNDVSFETPFHSDNKSKLLLVKDTLEDNSTISIDEYNDILDKKIAIKRIKIYLSSLPKKQQTIIMEKFLKYKTLPTDEEIGKALGIRTSSVCKFKNKAIEQIKKDLF